MKQKTGMAGKRYSHLFFQVNKVSYELDFMVLSVYYYTITTQLQAEKYRGSLEKTFNRIAKNPEMYPLASHIRKGYRYCVHTFLVFGDE